MKITRKSCILSLALLSGVASAHGALIAFDPFHSTSSSEGADPANGLYYANVDGGNGSLAGDINQNAAGGGIVGFGSHAWNSSTNTFRAQISSLPTASRLPDAEGGVRVLNFNGGSTTNHRTASRQLDSYTPSSTYYMSGVLEANTVTSGNTPGGYLMIGFGNSAIIDASTMTGTSSSAFEGLLWGFRANETGDRLDFVVRATTDASTNTVTDFVIAEGINQRQQYFLAARVDITEGGADTVTVWLDPGFSTSDPTGGITFEAEAFSTIGAISHLGMVQSGLVHTGGSGSTNRVGYIDSIALGTDYAAVIPEPSTYALIFGGISLLALGLARARRSTK